MIVASASSSPDSNYGKHAMIPSGSSYNPYSHQVSGNQPFHSPQSNAMSNASSLMYAHRMGNGASPVNGGVLNLTQEGPQSPDSMQLQMSAMYMVDTADPSDTEEMEMIRDLETAGGPIMSNVHYNNHHEDVVLIQGNQGVDTKMVQNVLNVVQNDVEIESDHSDSDGVDVDDLENGDSEGDDDLVNEINKKSLAMGSRQNMSHSISSTRGMGSSQSQNMFKIKKRRGGQSNATNVSSGADQYQRYRSGGTASTYLDDMDEMDVDDMDILDDLEVDTPKGPEVLGGPSLEEDELLEEAVSPLGHQQIDDPFGAQDINGIAMDDDIGNPLANEMLMYDVDDVQFGYGGNGVVTKD